MVHRTLMSSPGPCASVSVWGGPRNLQVPGPHQHPHSRAVLAQGLGISMENTQHVIDSLTCERPCTRCLASALSLLGLGSGRSWPGRPSMGPQGSPHDESRPHGCVYAALEATARHLYFSGGCHVLGSRPLRTTGRVHQGGHCEAEGWVGG